MHITLPTQPKLIEKKDNEAVFEIENLYPGYGITIGNALRRVLLSSLRGAAITAVRIHGVNHEFSTIPHVLEDVIEIILNLKQIRIRLHGNEPQKLSLKVKGERDVKAKDLQGPSQVEIVTPEAHIATLTDKKAEFEMELDVEAGIGYQTVETRMKEKLSIGTIAVDAIFTPVRKVNYEVENMRVGERTDFNRVRLTIETDGTIAPEDALRQATQILVDQFRELLVAGEPTMPLHAMKEVKDVLIEKEALLEGGVPRAREEEVIPSDSSTSSSGTNISSLNLSARTFNALNRANVFTVDELVKRNERELKSMRGLGDKGLKEIKKELGKLGLTLNLSEE